MVSHAEEDRLRKGRIQSESGQGEENAECQNVEEKVNCVSLDEG